MKRTNLKLFRVGLNLKSKDMAEILKVNPTYYSNIENGRIDPSFEVAERFGEIFRGKYDDYWVLFKKTE